MKNIEEWCKGLLLRYPSCRPQIKAERPTSSSSQAKQPASKSKEIINKCNFCTGTHPRAACPAYGKTCNNCGKIGHYSNNAAWNRNPTTKNVFTPVDSEPKPDDLPDLTDNSSDDDGDNDYFLGAITEDKKDELFIGAIDSENSKDWLITLDSDGLLLTYKLDTGAQANVISTKQFFNKLRKKLTLPKTKTRLTAYNITLQLRLHQP